MTTDLDIFLNAPDDLAPEDLPAYLDHACGNDEELRKKAEALFAEDRLESGIVDQLPKPSGGPREDLEAEGNIIHNYKLLQKIGEGGFGDVYMAEQFKPVKRRVALKIIKLGMDTKQVVARFEAERQALAMMDHPNIAKVHDAGATELGRPFFVMELVRGIPITKFCDEQNLDTKDRLALFIDVCHAVQHAHQKGVIHRDLKPSNVMVTMHDDKPVVKVIDFGVAKATQTDLTDKTLFTKFDQFIGTPAYMSPEQAQFSGLDIDTRSDIYTLGVLLYELLTGSTPFDSKQMLTAGYDEIRRIIKEDEPELPSSRLSTFGKAELTDLAKHRRTVPTRLHSLVKGDLDWIVMKAIEKDRTRRYETANAFAADISRHLADEPVVAAAPSTLYRLRKFAQRKKGIFASAAAITALLIAGTIVSTVLALRAKTAEQTAERALTDKGEALIKSENALDRAYAAVTRAAHRNLQVGEIGQAWADLNLFRPAEGERDRRGWEWYYVASLTDQSEEAIPAGQGILHAVCSSPLGEWIASAGTTGTVKIWDAKTRTQMDLLKEHKAAVLALSWQPGENSLLASASEDHTALIWDVNSGRVKTRLTGHLDRVEAVAWHPTGSIVATGGADGRILIWNPENGNRLDELKPILPVLSLAWTSDGAHLIAGLDDANDNGRIMTWKVEEVGTDGLTFDSSKIEIKMEGHGDGNSIVGIPGTSLLAVGSDQKLAVYDFKKKARQINLEPHGDTINSVALHPSPEPLLATASNDGLIKVWTWTDPKNADPDDPEPGKLRHRRDLLGHRGAVRSVCWDPQGDRLISGGEDGMIRFWNPKRQMEGVPLFKAKNWISQVAWSPDGRNVAVTYWKEEAVILDSATGQVLGKLEGEHTDRVARVSWSPNRDRLATPSYDGTVVIWDVKTLAVTGRLEHSENMESAWWSPDGNWLACGTWYWNTREGDDHDKVTMWDLSEGEPRRAFVFGVKQGESEETYERISRFAWHPDGELIATSGRLGGVKLWNPKGELIRVVKEAAPEGSHHRDQPTALAWNRKGDRLAMALDRGALILYAKVSGKDELRLLYEQESRSGSNINRMVWSPDSTRIALSRRGGLITLHDAATGQYLMKLDHAAAANLSSNDTFQWIFALDWSPDGTKIVSGGTDGVVRMWSAEKGYEMEARE